MAAKSSSCAVWVRRQPMVTPLSSGFTSTVRSPLSQVSRSKPVSPARYRSRPCESAATLEFARFDASVVRMNRALDHAAHARNQVWLLADGHDAGGGSDDVYNVAEAHSCADRVPVGVDCADRYRDSRRKA